VCLASHYATTPALEACVQYEAGWVAQLFARNLVLIW